MPYSDKEKKRQYQKQYRLDHKDEWEEYHKNYSKQWYKDNLSEISLKHKQYRDDHKTIDLNNRKQLKIQVLSHYSNDNDNPTCKTCGENHIEFLEIDHINGGGREHRKQLHLYGNVLYRWLIKNNYPSGFQVLCSNCNTKKVKISAKLKSESGTSQQKASYKYNSKIKLDVFLHYSNDLKCSCPNCNVNDIDVLCLDHINNDGVSHRKISGYGVNMYKWLIKNNYPSNIKLRLLCHNCNQSLGNYGYCPHN